MSKEKVDHPSHYGGDTTYEHIKVVEAWGLNYALGNATKYICRAGKKTRDELEDLEKARWYLDHEIARVKREREPDPPTIMREEKPTPLFDDPQGCYRLPPKKLLDGEMCKFPGCLSKAQDHCIFCFVHESIDRAARAREVSK